MEFTHKANPVQVNALQITDVFPRDPNPGVAVRFNNGDQTRLNEEMIVRHFPAVGDYVVTQEDGYVYLNPKDVFERKYSPINNDLSDPEIKARYPE